MSRIDLSSVVMGLLFIGLGTAFLLDRLDVVTLDFAVVWPVVLIGLGLSVLVGAARRARR